MERSDSVSGGPVRLRPRRTVRVAAFQADPAARHRRAGDAHPPPNPHRLDANKYVAKSETCGGKLELNATRRPTTPRDGPPVAIH